jgi:hypothetical protein
LFKRGKTLPHVFLRNLIAVCAFALLASACTQASPGTGTYVYESEYRTARPAMPSLVTTSQPAPDVIYRRGSRDTVLAGSAADVSRETRLLSTHVETLVTRKVDDLNGDLAALQRSTSGYQSRLNGLQAKSDTDAAQYYDIVASINTELQSGTTAGNPLLIERWNLAQTRLDSLAQSAGLLNGLATDLANEASKASFLQENVRAAYALSGAVKEDHERLRLVEDGVNQQIVYLNRLLTAVNDEITRRTTYLRTENLNLQTLSLAINKGELYGQNITNTMFRKATDEGPTVSAPVPATRRPLVIIRFDRPNVNYEEALYSAVSQALDKYPAARFDLVAVSPTKGNPAQLALASSEARKNGEAVMRSLTQMGLPTARIRLNAANSAEVRNSEVHIYLQ